MIRGIIQTTDSSDSLNEPDPVKSIVDKYKIHPSTNKIKTKYKDQIIFLSDQLLPRMSLKLFLRWLIQSNLVVTFPQGF